VFLIFGILDYESRAEATALQTLRDGHAYSPHAQRLECGAFTAASRAPRPVPAGTIDTSPAFQRREPGANEPSPAGTAERGGVMEGSPIKAGVNVEGSIHRMVRASVSSHYLNLVTAAEGFWHVTPA
jgi:hypothetical protein